MAINTILEKKNNVFNSMFKMFGTCSPNFRQSRWFDFKFI